MGNGERAKEHNRLTVVQTGSLGAAAAAAAKHIITIISYVSQLVTANSNQPTSPR